jgi:protein-tyrosine phosphatase
MRRMVYEKSLSDDIEVDSAGTGAWHEGQRADERARATASAHGLQLSGRARCITDSDFTRFDLILAVDDHVLSRVRSLAPGGATAVVRKFTEEDVPDPYYGGSEGFADVFAQIERGCLELLSDLKSGLAPESGG